jgi:hypothetical protein
MMISTCDGCGAPAEFAFCSDRCADEYISTPEELISRARCVRCEVAIPLVPGTDNLVFCSREHALEWAREVLTGPTELDRLYTIQEVARMLDAAIAHERREFEQLGWPPS